jgi:hypothetical protein
MQVIQFEGCHGFIIVIDVLPLSMPCDGLKWGCPESQVENGAGRTMRLTWSAELKLSGLHQKRPEESSNATTLGPDRSYDMQYE